jgi:hypothetical protein
VRLTVSLGILLTLSLACAANTRQRGEVEFPRPEAWSEKRFDDLGIRLRMPADPEMRVRRTTADDGGPMSVTTGVVMNHELALGFTVFTDPLGFVGHPMTGEGALMRVAAGTAHPTARDAGDSEVRDERDIFHRGFPGRQATLVNARDGLVMRIRYFVGQRRAYAVFAAMAVQDERRLGEWASRYFDTMTLEPSDAPSPRGEGGLDFGAWIYAYPPEAAFAVEMPGRAGRSDVGLVLEGNTYPTRAYSVTDGRRTFSVIETRFGEPPNGAVLTAVRAKLVGAGLTVTSERDVQLQGYPGRELDLGAEGVVVRSQLYLTASRLYEVRVSVPRGEEASTRAHRDRFFRSFRIL